MGWREELDAKRKATERWIADRNAQLRKAGGEVEEALRRTVNLTGREPQGVSTSASGPTRQATVSVQSREPRSQSAPARSAASGASRSVGPAQVSGPTLAERARAAGSGFADEASFGLADPFLSAVDAVSEGGFDGGLEGLKARYASGQERRAKEDQRDERAFAVERGAGRVVGFGASLVAMGGAANAAKAIASSVPIGAKAARLLATAPRLRGVTQKGLVTMFAGSGAGGAALGQGLEDVSAHRASPVADYVARMAGGAIGGVATLRGGLVRGGAAEGVATSVLSDIVHGSRPSVEHALEAGRTGALVSGLVGSVAEGGAAVLSATAKGMLGETMSNARILASGDTPVIKPRVPLRSGGASVPDFEVERGWVDAKLGPYARKTPNQLRLEAENPGLVAWDAWSFPDVGRLAASALTPFAIAPADPEFGFSYLN